ncbi:MAG: AAA family ATPase [Spirochaetota bacterium]
MIQEFSITNFLSIRDTVTLSFLPKASYNAEGTSYHLIEIDDQVKLLKAAILYGANASGKSNIISSLAYFHELLTNNRRSKEEPTGQVPFLFDKKTVSEPSRFELICFIKGIKYSYAIEVNKNRILSERMHYYPQKKPAKVFERFHNDVSFGQTLGLTKFEREIIKGNCIDNISLIASLGKVNITNKVLEDVFLYVQDTILPVITPKTDLQGWAMEQFEHMDEKEKQLILSLLDHADFNIKSVNVRSEEIKVDDDLLEFLKRMDASENLMSEIKHKGSMESKILEFFHEFNGGGGALDSESESSGTRRFFGLSHVLKKLIFSSNILAIDEIGSSLHPDLLFHFFLTFIVNSSKSQLICATHNQVLLNEQAVRRDMIWFCEKDRERGDTVLHRGSDYGIHKNNLIGNFYRIGKLGAVPELGSVQLFDADGECVSE